MRECGFVGVEHLKFVRKIIKNILIDPKIVNNNKCCLQQRQKSARLTKDTEGVRGEGGGD